MAQWINVLPNNSFVNPTRLPLLCEKTGALAIVEPGLTAGGPLGRQNCCKVRKLNSVYLTFKMHIRYLNRFLALIKLYQ